LFIKATLMISMRWIWEQLNLNPKATRIQEQQMSRGLWDEGKGRTVAGAVDGDLLALCRLGAGAGSQDLLLETHPSLLLRLSPGLDGFSVGGGVSAVNCDRR